MRRVLLAMAAVVLAATPLPAAAADCAKTTTALVPLTDLGTGTYKGAQGGLYPGGTNAPPQAYAAAGRRVAAEMVPRAASGQPDPGGAIVLLSIGMSNTTQEFSRFVTLAKTDTLRDPQVIVVDGAQGGQDARVWSDPKAAAWGVADQRLRAAGATAAQVQAIWLKQAMAGPRGDFASSGAELERALDAIVLNAVARYPNLAQIFLSPRTYAGYAITTLNPEPYAYETAFVVKRLVERSVREPSARPWIGWGPYLWTDGTKGRSDGFTWTCADVAADGVHPSPAGQAKVAQLLQAFFDGSEFTSWYRDAPATVQTAAPAATQAAAPVSPGPGAVVAPGAAAEIPPWAYAAAALTILGAAALTLRRTRRPS
ncbi:MAG TPA: hypothetical protein VFW12_04595 [Candidatus Limnocylindria bacterium]|nr:hypothetical protein [Candidatus Limnocylindria bacterium]